MKKYNLILLAVIALLFSACEKDETATLVTISGNVAQQDAITPKIISPLEGIEMYLLKLPVTIDTLTNWFTDNDIAATTQTDANGFYQFSQLQAGDYAVFPADTITGYNFDCADSSPDSVCSLANNTQTDYEINFITPEPIVNNSADVYSFQFNNIGNISAIGSFIIYQETQKWKWSWWHYVWSKSYMKSVGSKHLEAEISDDKVIYNYTVNQNNTEKYRFEDKFQFKIIKKQDLNTIGTYTVDDLKELNTWDINWINYLEIEVTRTN